MSAAKQCWNCDRVRPLDAFPKTNHGTGRADICAECAEQRLVAYRVERGLTAEAPPPKRRQSNRPQRRVCEGCGESVPTPGFWYRGQQRMKFCIPCYRLQRIERPCGGCGLNKRAAEFDAERHISPLCRECREVRAREKHCPQCHTTKPLSGFTQSHGKASGWCKQCTVQRNRERRARARAEKA